LLIATALVVAIRTASWEAKGAGEGVSDIDHDLDREVEFAARVTDRVMRILVRKRPAMFPSRLEAIDEPEEGESPA
jgi:hypothetical protein